MLTTLTAGPGQRQRPGAVRSPMWVAGTQVLVPSPLPPTTHISQTQETKAEPGPWSPGTQKGSGYSKHILTTGPNAYTTRLVF